MATTPTRSTVRRPLSTRNGPSRIPAPAMMSKKMAAVKSAISTPPRRRLVTPATRLVVPANDIKDRGRPATALHLSKQQAKHCRSQKMAVKVETRDNKENVSGSSLLMSPKQSANEIAAIKHSKEEEAAQEEKEKEEEEEELEVFFGRVGTPEKQQSRRLQQQRRRTKLHNARHVAASDESRQRAREYAAVVIQAWVRGHLVRRVAARERAVTTFRRVALATMVAKLALRKARASLRRRNAAATVIQCAWRTHSAEHKKKTSLAPSSTTVIAPVATVATIVTTSGPVSTQPLTLAEKRAQLLRIRAERRRLESAISTGAHDDTTLAANDIAKLAQTSVGADYQLAVTTTVPSATTSAAPLSPARRLGLGQVRRSPAPKRSGPVRGSPWRGRPQRSTLSDEERLGSVPTFSLTSAARGGLRGMSDEARRERDIGRVTRINTLKNGSTIRHQLPPTHEAMASAAFYALKQRRRAINNPDAVSPPKEASKITWAPRLCKESPCQYPEDCAAARRVLRASSEPVPVLKLDPASPVMIMPRPQALLARNGLLDYM